MLQECELVDEFALNTKPYNYLGSQFQARGLVMDYREIHVLFHINKGVSKKSAGMLSAFTVPYLQKFFGLRFAVGLHYRSLSPVSEYCGLPDLPPNEDPIFYFNFLIPQKYWLEVWSAVISSFTSTRVFPRRLWECYHP